MLPFGRAASDARRRRMAPLGPVRSKIAYRKRAGLVLALTLFAWGFAAQAAKAEVEVDVSLVLAVDISFSMDLEEQALQRDGFVKAFRASEVHDAIGRGLIGAIAVTYFEWASANDQYVVIPWTLIDGPTAAMAFADELEARPIRRARRTSISGAIEMGLRLLDESGVVPMREVIDISGDGPNNEGRMVTLARDEAVARGVTINGLPLMLKQPGYLDIHGLDDYFVDCVIGGPGAFVIPVRERDQFPEAIRQKIILEIANLTPEQPSIHRAQQSGEPDCLVGERQWRNRRFN
jgi:hypothetical protein